MSGSRAQRERPSRPRQPRKRKERQVLRAQGGSEGLYLPRLNRRGWGVWGSPRRRDCHPDPLVTAWSGPPRPLRRWRLRSALRAAAATATAPLSSASTTPVSLGRLWTRWLWCRMTIAAATSSSLTSATSGVPSAPAGVETALVLRGRMGGSRGDEPIRAYVALAAGSSYCEHVLSADVVPRAHLIHVGREATQLRLQMSSVARAIVMACSPRSCAKR